MEQPYTDLLWGVEDFPGFWTTLQSDEGRELLDNIRLVRYKHHTALF